MEKTILVVDDDPRVAHYIEEALKLNNYHVLTVMNGLEAFKETLNHHIDLILMDIRMPFFSGIWFCDAFHRKKSTSNIPVVIVSAFLEEINEKRARMAGAVDFIKKPFTVDELLKVVGKNAL